MVVGGGESPYDIAACDVELGQVRGRIPVQRGGRGQRTGERRQVTVVGGVMKCFGCSKGAWVLGWGGHLSIVTGDVGSGGGVQHFCTKWVGCGLRGRVGSVSKSC